MSSSKEEVAKASCSGGCKDLVFSLTEPRVHDSTEGIVLIEDVVLAPEIEGKRVKKVLADKGYDSMFDGLRDKRITSEIIPRKGSKARGRGSTRDDAMRVLKNAVESLLLY